MAQETQFKTNELCALLTKDNVNKKILRKYKDHSDILIRILIALNKNVDIDILEQYQNDKSIQVRMAVVETGRIPIKLTD